MCICWRMGYGETYMEVFWEWWRQNENSLDKDQRIDYFRLWPPPASWLTFMINVIWDLRSGKKKEDKRAPDYNPRDEDQNEEQPDEEDEDEYESEPEDEGWIEPEGFDYTPYFKQIEALGFGTQKEFEDAFNAEAE